MAGALLLALGTFEQPKPGEPVWEFFDGQPNAKLVIYSADSYLAFSMPS